MRVSGYNIISYLENEGRALIMHGYSGAVDVTDHNVAHILERYIGRDLPKGILPQETIDLLQSRGYLTEKTALEEQESIVTMGKTLMKVLSRKNKESCLIIPTYDCNLRCTYCYELRLRERGQQWLKQKMTTKHVDRVLAVAEELAGDNGIEAFILYGGEPFLPENYPLIEYIVKVIRAKGFKLNAVTNGVGLGHYLPLLGPGRIETLQITLDGDRNIHNRRRKSADGSDTYDSIVANITAALEVGAKVSLRINIDTDNVDSISTIYNLAKSQGWLERPVSQFDIYPAAIRYIGEKHVTQLTIWQKVDENNLGEHVCRHTNWFLALYHTLKERKPLRYRPYYCTAVVNMKIFDPHGDIYPCWDVVGQSEERIGTYLPRLELFPETRARWGANIGFTRQTCISCKYVLFCGGGCSRLMLMGDRIHCREFPRALTRDLAAAYLAVTQGKEPLAVQSYAV